MSDVKCRNDFRRLENRLIRREADNFKDFIRVVYLLEHLECGDPILRLEAANELTEFMYHKYHHAELVIDAGAVPILVRLLHSPHQDVCALAIDLIAEISFLVCDDGELQHSLIVELGVLDKLLSLIESEIPLTFQRSVLRAIPHICVEWPQPLPADYLKRLLPALGVLMKHTDDEILTYTVDILEIVMECEDNEMQLAIDCNIVSNLVLFLSHEHSDVQMGSVHTVHTLIRFATDEHLQAILDCGALNHFPALLTHQDYSIALETLDTLGDIVVRGQQQVLAVIDADLTPLIINHLSSVISSFGVRFAGLQDTYWIKRCAARALRNMMLHANKNQVAYLLSLNAITPFCNLISLDDDYLFRVVLQGIDKILPKVSEKESDSIRNTIEKYTGPDKVEALTSDESEAICELAKNIGLFHSKSSP